ncbi:TlpA family protein disulfide reductase [Flavilitoribacter nigricans]|uniref:Alkyl hydroperoxide reductase n=1 Tax=Flavilitoribacter nigricans (strain ATCC 23147 / DSM 23189 / NBRC 102662 / NCIMB 1420 / SS-2) TaxID=1122177 RepID=A0A2D0NHU7_FLAN2|nr:TlpA disulfide reductase family protein [Flavilitoribacter nigricans]PHN08084.1 alkyl hydroperoxide reductase [Flavilitoribacter nigricans DSM 23189 = NBRC 102662]
MKVLNVLAVFFFVLLSAPGFSQNTLPSTNLKTLDGKNVDLISFADNGKTTIISMWATWCAPCKKELDAIAEVYEEWQSKYNVELVAITIDTQRQLAKVKPMVESKGWKFTILSDANNQLRNSMGVVSIPQTFVVSSSGEIVFSHTGYSPGDEFELEEQLKLLVNE